MPDLSPVDNAEKNQINIVVQADGSAHLEVKSLLKGVKHEWYRNAVDIYSHEDFRKEFQKNSSLQGLVLEEIQVMPSKEYPQATLTYKATVLRYGNKQGKRLFIPVNQINPFTAVPTQNAQRQNSVFVRMGYLEENKTEFKLPENYEVESLAIDNISIENAFGSYKIKIKQGEGTVIIERRLEILPVRLPASEYGAWRDFHKEIAKFDAAKLVLIEKKT